MMDALNYMLVIFREPMLILLVAIGTFLGIYTGAIPGLTGTMKVSLLVSFTFGWHVNQALAVIVGVFVGVVYGSARTAILLNIPGGPSAVATTLDGYPLAQKGYAGEAMGICTVQSFIGTLFGVIVLATAAPLVSRVALNLHSIDFLLFAVMALLMVGGLGAKSIKRGLIAAAIGLFLGTIGVDPQTAVRRFTFDIVYLNAGVDFIVAMVGLFGASEALLQLTTLKQKVHKQKIDKIVPSWKETVKHFPLTVRSAIIGVLIGVLPGAGGDMVALMAYDQAKRSVRKPKVPFGEGAIEGLIAPETANSAAVGGAFIPMLSLGIPGDAVTAVIISALTIHGLRPGPNLQNHTPDLFWLIVILLVLSSFFLLIFGMTGIKLFTKIVEIPKAILMPMILLLSVVGSYAIRNSMYDVFWMFGFGILGFLLKRFDYPIAPVVLGIILRTLFEDNFRRGTMLQGSVGGMFLSIFNSPISTGLFILTVFLFASQTKWYKAWREKRNDAFFEKRAAKEAAGKK